MLESLLYPNSIAVIGASSTPGKVGHAILKNLIEGGFEGAIVPVNPKAAEILGLKCIPDLKQYTGKIDLSVISVPSQAVKQAILDSIAIGVKSIIVITAGFKETGEAGAQLEHEIVSLKPVKSFVK